MAGAGREVYKVKGKEESGGEKENEWRKGVREWRGIKIMYEKR